jgi:hypothetical protein
MSEEDEHSRITTRPGAEQTSRPGDSGVSMEEYLGLVGSTRPPPSPKVPDVPLDELIAAILDGHEREKVAGPSLPELVLDIDALWDKL